jgi:hypothetical protein
MGILPLVAAGPACYWLCILLPDAPSLAAAAMSGNLTHEDG